MVPREHVSDSAQDQRIRFGAGIGASLVAETVFILSKVPILAATGGDVWAVVRIPAAMAVGPEAMRPTGWVPADVLLGGAMHVGMAILVGILYAILLPRLGISAVAGGLLAGAVLYLFGFLVLPAVFPDWLAPFRLTPIRHLVEIAMHGAYGLVFGWSYRRWWARSSRLDRSPV